MYDFQKIGFCNNDNNNESLFQFQNFGFSIWSYYYEPIRTVAKDFIRNIGDGIFFLIFDASGEYPEKVSGVLQVAQHFLPLEYQENRIKAKR